jgi:diguanylate cyclase (GGDEF)-like protein
VTFLRFVVVFTIGAVAGAVALRWLVVQGLLGSRRAREPGLERRTAPDRTQDALLAAFRPEEIPDPADALREDQRILADALRDIAKRRGAVAAVLWAIDEDAGGIATPVASSADDARSSLTPAILPVLSVTDRDRVEWSARNEMVTVERAPNAPLLAIAPLEALTRPGALSLHYDAQAAPDLAVLRADLMEHARAMESLYGLVRTRADVARQNFRLRGLIRTAGTLQATRDPLELEQLLVLDSLPVVGAEWSVLVRWEGEQRAGEVRAATLEAMELGIPLDGLAVTAESLVGQVCLEGRPQVFTDARPLARVQDTIFGSGARVGVLGSLLAVPLRRSDQDRPIGALVCGHRDVASLRAVEARNAKNLAVIAAGALETAWAVEDARRNARTDPLTGLANRRGFDERYAQVIQETDRYGGTAALILVDVDHFKRVNDTYGHEAGDEVLIAVANALADGRRTVDITARLGGEELAILLPQTDAGGGREVAERMRKRIEGLAVRTPNGEIKVTASFGVSEYATRSGESEHVVERADQALYAAKRNGRNRVEVMA